MSMATLFIEDHRPFNFAHLLTSVRLVLTPVFLLAIEYSRQQPTPVTRGLCGWALCGYLRQRLL